MTTKKITWLIILLALSMVILFKRPLKIMWYEMKDIPEFEMRKEYSIVSDKEGNFYLREIDSGRVYYYQHFYWGRMQTFSVRQMNPKRLVSKKHAMYIYYKGVYKEDQRIKEFEENAKL